MPIPEVLHALLTAPGPSGSESEAAGVFARAASRFADVTTDVMGNVVARVRRGGEGPSIAVVAHIDEIGLVISHIDEEGYLYFAGVGGWDSTVLVGQRVSLRTADGEIPGVIGRKPVHVLEQSERDKPPDLKDLHIDIGARDAESARKLVEVGDPAVIAAQPAELQGRLVSRSLDNRIGAYVALEVLRRAAEDHSTADVVAVAAVQEETTYGGARTSAFALDPDVAIVIDTTHATDAPGMDPKQSGEAALGTGPSVGRGSSLHPGVYRGITAMAKSLEIPYTVSASAHETGTDADAINLTRAGIPTGLVSIPLRYMHSPVEMVALSDADDAARLVAAYAARVSAEGPPQR